MEVKTNEYPHSNESQGFMFRFYNDTTISRTIASKEMKRHIQMCHWYKGMREYITIEKCKPDELLVKYFSKLAPASCGSMTEAMPIFTSVSLTSQTILNSSTEKKVPRVNHETKNANIISINFCSLRSHGNGEFTNLLWWHSSQNIYIFEEKKSASDVSNMITAVQFHTNSCILKGVDETFQRK